MSNPDPNCEFCEGEGVVPCPRDCHGCGCQNPNAMPPCTHCTSNHGLDCECVNPMLVGAMAAIEKPALASEKLDELSGLFGIEFVPEEG